MKFSMYQLVQKVGGGLSGVVVNNAPAIEKYGVQSAYEITWVDGTTSVHMESELEKAPDSNKSHELYL